MPCLHQCLSLLFFPYSSGRLCADASADACMQLDEEGVFPGEGSPQARAGMAEILREIGYSDEEIFESPKQEQTPGDVSDDAGAGVSGDDGDGSAADEQPTGRQRPVELAAAESTVQVRLSQTHSPLAHRICSSSNWASTMLISFQS